MAQELHNAQAEIERHLVTGPDGRCLTCGEIEPCTGRVRAGRVFASRGLLPKRRPGITTVGTRTLADSHGTFWFGGR
ncbi:MAG: hypothetical protein AUI14_18385 [Actinobacteria bacterium 13_2_20CM_2_71_6]|nr:MAG: hypothetical protein AUI14_18385 [Actinobacteria bacterium 13_2_20CM_2_71_6]